MVDVKQQLEAGGNGASAADQVAARTPVAAQDRRELLPVLGFREYWYPAMPVEMVRKKPRPWRMLGTNLVFFRGKEKGTVACISSVCIHRGANLGEGSCHWRGTITCPYHGWTYDEHGGLLAVLTEGPHSLSPDNGYRARMYPTQVLKGMVFVWMGEREPAPIEEQIMHLFALKLGILDPLSNQALKRFRKEILEYARREFPDAMKELTTKWELTTPLKKQLEEIFRSYFSSQR